MTPKEARGILGMVNGYSSEPIAYVKKLFADKVRAMHPDLGGAGGNLDNIKEARDVLIASLGGESACKQCRGRGYIKARMGSVECGRCGGEGTAI